MRGRVDGRSEASAATAIVPAHPSLVIGVDAADTIAVRSSTRRGASPLRWRPAVISASARLCRRRRRRRRRQKMQGGVPRVPLWAPSRFPAAGAGVTDRHTRHITGNVGYRTAEGSSPGDRLLGIREEVTGHGRDNVMRVG